MTLGDADRLSAQDLERIERALVRYRAPGEAAAVLRLVGRVHRALMAERWREQVVAQDLGAATGRPALVLLPALHNQAD